MSEPINFNANNLNKLKSFLMGEIGRELENHPLEPGERRIFISNLITQTLSSRRVHLPPSIVEQVTHDILDDILGFGLLQPLLDDPDISEVMVNAYDKIYIERKGILRKTQIKFDNDEEVLRLIDRIILPLGRRIDADTPMVDARLPDGSRVNAAIRPVAIDGPSITIRKFMKDKLSVQQMIGVGTLTQNMADFLRACVIARLNILISGGTGSGKTTLLNVLSSYIPDSERIITIEDAAELRLQQENILRMETKPANTEGRYAITIRDLVRNSLRMRPDRIVVGEVRGGEALDMLQAMNTGHDGSLTTLHANSPRDAISRLETLILMAGVEFPVKVIRTQIASAIDLVIQLSRLKGGDRKITSITEISGMEGDTVVMTEIFKFEQAGVTPEGKPIGELKPTGIRPLFSSRLEAAGLKLSPEVFGAKLSNIISPGRK